MTDTSPDSYATLTGLIALLADSKASAKRIDELRKLEERTAAAQVKLDGDRAEYARTMAIEKSAADEQEKRIRAREVSVAIAERNLAEREQSLIVKLNESRPPHFPHDPNLFGSITREPYTDG
jgi:hypothetical protein